MVKGVWPCGLDAVEISNLAYGMLSRLDGSGLDSAVPAVVGSRRVFACLLAVVRNTSPTRLVGASRVFLLLR